ncbi:pentapeptide repeat-containing protein [Streptomyces sp. NPDC047070]|uniref:pentapeptide repeat-containing protein n=1 Tax=Streptomyces sp. NPDC047070 TaxID=3154923 RepID=UPI003451AC05
MCRRAPVRRCFRSQNEQVSGRPGVTSWAKADGVRAQCHDGYWALGDGASAVRKLVHANFLGANLTDVNLSSADLTGTALLTTDLSGAILAGANLHGANLFRVDLTGADLRGTT